MIETKSEACGRESGKWSADQYAGRTGGGSVIPYSASSYVGSEVSVDEIRSAAAASSNYYPPSIHGALVGSPDPYPPGGLWAHDFVLVVFNVSFNCVMFYGVDVLGSIWTCWF